MKFSMSEAWRDATAMLSANREVLWIVAGIFFFIPSVVLGLAIGDVQETMFADLEDMDQASQAMLSFYSDWGWLMALTSLASMVGYLTLLALLRDHNRPTVGEALKIGLTGLLPGIGAYLVLVLGLSLAGGVLIAIAAATGNAAVGFLVGLIMLVGLVYVLVKVSLAGAVIAIDKVYNPIRILTRSWQLTKGNSLRLFVFYLLLAIVYLVVAGIVGGIIMAVLLAVAEDVATMVNAVVSAAITAVAYMIFVAVLASVHRQLTGPSGAAVMHTFE